MEDLKKVLVVEDEDSIREFIVINLKRAGYLVTDVSSGEAALSCYKKNLDFNVVILDIMMPGMDGISVCRELRKISKDVGIIILSAKNQEMDKVTGLMMGADDYISKPFSPSELVARVDSVCRRVVLSKTKSSSTFREIITVGDFNLNLKKRTFSKNEKLIGLTQVEFQILEYFFSHPNVPLSRSDILNYVWGKNHTIDDEKIVDVNIRRLRMKIEDDPSHPKYIVTVWGMGYKFEV